MPNHVHGILIINNPNNNITPSNANTDDNKTIGQKRFQNQGRDTISSIVGSYKSVVTKHAHLIPADF